MMVERAIKNFTAILGEENIFNLCLQLRCRRYEISMK